MRWRLPLRCFPRASGDDAVLDSNKEPDQWTINNRFSATGALHRVALGDAAGTEVYVAEATGEIVMKTDGRAGSGAMPVP